MKKSSFLLSSGASLSYLLSAIWLLVAITNFSRYTAWRDNPRTLGLLIAGFSFAIFFAVVAGTITIVAYQLGADPFAMWRTESKITDPSESNTTPNEMTIPCPACKATNLRKRSLCHNCSDPLGAAPNGNNQ